MNAISIRQPWIELIIRGEKTLEVRSWRTKIRGDIILCASAAPKMYDLPTGQALCIANIVDCRRFLPSDAKKACCDHVDDFYVWELANIRAIQPFPVKGRLNFYQIQLPLGLQIYDRRCT